MYLVRVTGIWDSWCDTDAEMICVLARGDRVWTAMIEDALLVGSGIGAEFELEVFWKVGEDDVVACMFRLVVVFKNKADG